MSRSISIAGLSLRQRPVAGFGDVDNDADPFAAPKGHADAQANLAA